MKKTLGWINITIRRSGGFRYEEWVRQGLAPFFDVELKDISWSSLPKKFRQLKPFLWLAGLVALWFSKPKDVWIRGDIVSCILPLWTRRKNILMIHHIDPSVWPFWQRTLYRFLEGFIYRNAKGADAVVTISNYWQKHFQDRGFSNVYKIYNCFPVEEYNVSDEEVLEFKKKFQLEGKPVVYIGNCQKEKGVVIAYEALKDLPVHLVTSGEEQVKIPAHNLNLDRRSFLCLLKASSLGVFLTQFKTGWDMTACEAMLFKTPVIGTSIAAMRELLESSGQVICDNPSELKEKVEYLLSNEEERKRQGERGYEFVKNFTAERLQKEWVQVIEDVLI
ncbi:MAG: glycosyltransferase [bacterium]|nr:glycosyltransferase [bacterium]